MSQAPLDPQTTPEQALAAVEAAGEAAEQLVQLWLEARNAGAIAEVAEHGAGKARKAARRAVGVLKSRGVAVPDARKKSAARSVRAARVEAFMTAPDLALNVLFAIGSWPEGRRGKVALVYLNDDVGILNIRVAELAPSKLAAEVEELVGQYLKPFPVPLEFARARIHGARAKNGHDRVPVPLGWDSIAPLVGEAPQQAPAHPFDQLGIEVQEDRAAELVKQSALLHRMPEFGAWGPPQEAVDQLLVEVGQHLTPGTQPSEEELWERLQAAVDVIADRYCSPQLRERMLEAMRDSALSVQARAGREALESVIATMDAIRQRGLITDPPHELPFLRAMFEKGLHLLLRQGQGKLRIPVAVPAEGLAEEAAEDAATPDSLPERG